MYGSQLQQMFLNSANKHVSRKTHITQKHAVTFAHKALMAWHKTISGEAGCTLHNLELACPSSQAIS